MPCSPEAAAEVEGVERSPSETCKGVGSNQKFHLSLFVSILLQLLYELENRTPDAFESTTLGRLRVRRRSGRPA